MKIIKRNGAEAEFDRRKIVHAIMGANRSVGAKDAMRASCASPTLGVRVLHDVHPCYGGEHSG